MTTKLDRLLEEIDPSRTLDKVSAKVDEALNSFTVTKATIKSYDEFRDFFTKFFLHVETVYHRLPPDFLDYRKFPWNEKAAFLEKAFGQGGELAAFQIAKTGKEGGLYGLLKKVADQMVEERAQPMISACIFHYTESSSVDELLAAPYEYLRKYGHLLPAELTERGAGRLRSNFLSVLEEHPRMIQRIRRIGK